MADKTQDLELRIVQLENQIKELTGTKDIDPEDYKTWKKVNTQLGFDTEVCGINECKPIPICRVCKVCNICRVCRICDVCYECSCGPCSIVSTGMTGISRFNQFG